MTPLDGLSALQAKRDEATKSARHLPPPRRARSAGEGSDAPATTRGKASTTKREQTSKNKSVTVREASTEPAASQQASEAAGTHDLPPVSSSSALVRSTIYLGEMDDTWLQEISSLGRGRRPKVDASRSAVARLALERLRADMTQEEIVALLSARAEASVQSVGRKRL